MGSIIATGCNTKYYKHLKTLIASVFKYDNGIINNIHIYDIGLSKKEIKELSCIKRVIVFRLPNELYEKYPHFKNPKNFAWKTYIIKNEVLLQNNFLYIDSGACFIANFKEIFDIIQSKDIFLVQDVNQTNIKWCHETSLQLLNASATECNSFQLWAGLQGYKKNSKYAFIAHEAFQLAQNKNCIEGDVKSHRHDQCIYSILTTRYNCPTQDLYRFGEWRGAKMRSDQIIYVHRGAYSLFLKPAYYLTLQSFVKYEFLNCVYSKYNHLFNFLSFQFKKFT